MSALSHAFRSEQINLFSPGKLCMLIYYWLIIFWKKNNAICTLSHEGKAEVHMNSLLGVLPSHSLKILDMRSFFALKLSASPSVEM